MKFSVILYASAFALALTTDGAFAATNLNSSRSNTTKIDGSDAASKACTDKGGIVSTAPGGQKSCTVPPATCVASRINTGTVSSIDIDDAAAIRACFDACGTISTNEAGQKICTKPAATIDPAAPTTAREPHN